MAKKYIDADRLKAEIEGIRWFPQISSGYNDGREDMKMMVLDIIYSLQQEQPEVDLVAEYDEQFYSDPVYGKLVNRNAGMEIARHFYGLGLKANSDER